MLFRQPRKASRPRGAPTGLPLQKILQQRMPMLGQDRLGMELHALHRMLAVPQSHDLLHAAILVLRPRRHLQHLRQRRFVDHQRVISRRFITIGQPREYTAAVVPDRRSLAMHDPARTYHVATVALADALVPEAQAYDP